MRRRDFVVGAAMFASLSRQTLAQRAATTKGLAWVSPNAKISEVRIGGDAGATAFLKGLKRLGYNEGENLIIDRFSADGHTDRYGDLAREVVSTRPDVIYVLGTPLTRELKALTSTIPIVAFTGDPVRFGLIASLAHPGGNITGISADAGLAVWGKRLELLVEAAPNISRVVFVGSPGAWENPGGKSVQEVARRRGISVANAPLGAVKDEAEYRRVFSSIQRDQVDGIMFSTEVENYTYRFLLVQLVEQIRLPAIHDTRDQTEAGGLMSYSFDINDGVRTNAKQIVEILHGANPSEMPYQLADRFELVINLKAAKALGLEIPHDMVSRADAVIEQSRIAAALS